MIARAVGACSVALAVVATALPARAQDDTTLALTLFEEGKRLADTQEYANACPKFLDSYKLAPKLGTLLNLADCYEKIGKTASAWARFTEAISIAEAANQGERAAFARQHADDLAKSLATLTITAPNPPPNLQITRDGTALDPSSLDVAIPVDPGTHLIEITAPKKLPLSLTVIVPKSAAQTLEIPALEAAPEPPPVATRITPPCKEGDASCGRPFASKRIFIQLRIAAATCIGGFVDTPPSALYGPGTRYPGASYAIGGGFEAGLQFLFGLKPLPAGVAGSFNAVVIEPVIGAYGGATLGFAPTTDQSKGSGDFFFRAGVTLAFQVLHIGKRSVDTGQQYGIGFLVGYRPALQYAYVEGYFKENGVSFVHGPNLGAVFPVYWPGAARLARGLLEVAFLHVPATSSYFVTFGGGAAF